METADLIGAFLAAVLTIMVLSYLIGDNPLFRLAMHLLIGVAGGYAGAVAIHNVLRPGLVTPVLEASNIVSLDLLVSVGIPLVLVVLLFFKVAPSTSPYGTLSMAFLVGIGAAVAVGGAISGTLIPQTLAATQSLSPTVVGPQTGETGPERTLAVGIMLLATITTLFYFRFTVLQGNNETPLARLGGLNIPGPVSLVSSLGKGFIAITFGVMYAGVLAAALIVLSQRMQFIWTTLTSLFDRLG